MFWDIFFMAFIFYVIYSLWVIKNQLDVIMKNLNISQEEKVSNDEIEKELEDEFEGTQK
ncbi:hypothetical protein [Bacillus suaedaesalsae]|uniref:Uncharacterized protein n=1 Tax=Bacillus suaedaesalsae TaxID=2810349 RepID=A0ABS2DHK8_9BACI|nr:hypothetical protein [Bacillus suaedaesalsae]MBM6617892.1 hypothetical protein [Bacillus suaedaesalsae]